jgi:hypothetical protein
MKMMTKMTKMMRMEMRMMVWCHDYQWQSRGNRSQVTHSVPNTYRPAENHVLILIQTKIRDFVERQDSIMIGTEAMRRRIYLHDDQCLEQMKNHPRLTAMKGGVAENICHKI